jgi:two-component system, chemotaxis family, response regulator Rcp1
MAIEIETKKKVLLIENDPKVATLIGHTLKEMGLLGNLEVSDDCRDALARLRQSGGGRPRLILLDIEMPDQSAFAFLEAAKMDPTLRVIPVVILAPDDGADVVAACYAAGAAGYLVKSDFGCDFAEKIRNACGYWALSRVPMA